MIACEKGNLPLVKLLLDVYHCDDSIIAPDGQLALRLASFFKHREIVDYLPVRRGGGMKRWKCKIQTLIFVIPKNRVYMSASLTYALKLQMIRQE